MTTDGGLRQLFRKHIPEAHWTGVETGGTGRGIPDDHYCLEGFSGWVEDKVTSAWAVGIWPEQIAWFEKQARHGGRVLLAVRRQHAGGVRKGPKVDELWVFDHRTIRDVAMGGLLNARNIHHSTGGPARWNWDAVRALMKETPR